MDIKLIVALIAIVGVLSSALVQFLLGRKSEKSKKALEVRTEAYLDLVNAVSDIASTTKQSEGKLSVEQFSRLMSSRARIVLIGSSEVISEVQIYFNTHKMLYTDESCEDFSNIISAMRTDLIGKNEVANSVLADALFGASAKQ